MYELNAYKVCDGNIQATATVTASSETVLMDHLKASALRNGFEIGSLGDILKNGRYVGSWNVTEV